MSLKERISFDLKTALKNADSFRVGVLRLLLSSLQNEAIAKRGRTGSGDLTDEDALATLKKEAKKRKESIAIYSGTSRSDLLEAEERELKLIREYLPPELDPREIEIVVRKIVDSGNKEFSSIMKAAMAELKGAADGKTVSEIVKSVIG